MREGYWRGGAKGGGGVWGGEEYVEGGGGYISKSSPKMSTQLVSSCVGTNRLPCDENFGDSKDA